MFSLMGNCISYVKRRKEPPRDVTLAILGLDNAGKTVTSIGLQGGSIVDVAPTIGFDKSEFLFESSNITMFDLGGGASIRGIWKNYLANVYGIVFVVDSSTEERLLEARTALHETLENNHIAGKPLLLLANKQDVPGCLDQYAVVEGLQLEEVVNRQKIPCRVELCSAILGQGKKLDPSIKVGMQWILGMVEENYESLSKRVADDSAVLKARQAEAQRERAERVRKIREQRAKEEEEEAARQGVSAEGEDDGDIVGGQDPFKRLNFKELQEKEKGEKLARKKSKAKDVLPRSSLEDPQPSNQNSATADDLTRNTQPIPPTVTPRLPPLSALSAPMSPKPASRRGSPLPGSSGDLSSAPVPANRRLTPLLAPLQPIESGDAGVKEVKKKKKKRKKKAQISPAGVGNDDPMNMNYPPPLTGEEERNGGGNEWNDDDSPKFSQKWEPIDEGPEIASDHHLNEFADANNDDDDDDIMVTPPKRNGLRASFRGNEIST